MPRRIDRMKIEHLFPLDVKQDEFGIWTQFAKPALRLPPNVLGICEHGFTEMLNNVIDHSQGHAVTVRGEQTETTTAFEVEDDGVGVFGKLRNFFGFDSDLHALMELVKGKLTVAPQAHTGEGLFFSSKLFDRFVIESGELSVSFANDRCDVRIIPHRLGTLIRMEIANDSTRTTTQVFDQFCGGDEYAFYKTRFFLSLAAIEGNLVSRSQAKRVAARFEKFAVVELDFSGVESMGQAFADELLRVWPLAHPQTKLLVAHANEAVQKMVGHVQGRKDLPHVDDEEPRPRDDGGSSMKPF